jgi:glycosyltransferase involved in cell wall biosynthesis
MRSADLSVVLPNYNHAHFLPRALGALLSQSILPREIIVVDDGSTDDSAGVVEEFGRQSPLVRLVRNERNRGCVASVDRGVRLAVGKYLFLPAADDYVLPGFIEKLTGLLDQYPRAGLACGLLSTVDEITGRVRPNPTAWSTGPAYLSPEEFTRRVGATSIAGHSTIWRRAAFDEVGGYLPDLQLHSDWFASLVIAFRNGIGHVPEPLALMTVHPGSYSASASRDDGRMRQVHAALLDRLTSERFRDVAPAFASSGVMALLGPNLVRAAAARPDRWGPLVLSLVAGLPWKDYEEVLEDDDPDARELAAVLLGPRWLRVHQANASPRRALRLVSAKNLLRKLVSPRFWRLWLQARRGKRAADKWLMPASYRRGA